MAIQGPFSAFVSGIEGDYFNVVGLPIGHVYQAIKKLTNLKWFREKYVDKEILYQYNKSCSLRENVSVSWLKAFAGVAQW